jgi:hypothetical protein
MLPRYAQRSGRLLVALWWLFPAFAAIDSTISQKLEQNPIVLIAQGGSYLERAVSGCLNDSLSKKGILVKIIPLESLKNEQSSRYRATIIMNAVKSSKLQGIARAYARAMDARKSNILICTVYGEEWKRGTTVSDAVSEATVSLNPADVAAKLLRGLDAIMSIK